MRACYITYKSSFSPFWPISLLFNFWHAVIFTLPTRFYSHCLKVDFDFALVSIRLFRISHSFFSLEKLFFAFAKISASSYKGRLCLTLAKHVFVLSLLHYYYSLFSFIFIITIDFKMDGNETMPSHLWHEIKYRCLFILCTELPRVAYSLESLIFFLSFLPHFLYFSC